MRKPFKKHIPDIITEDAHGDAGSRKLLLSQADPVSMQLDAMTKGFLMPGRFFDWHSHDNIDEFFLVTKGSGIVEFENNETMNYNPGDVVYIPANIKHKITNNGTVENEFFFIRLNK